MTDGREIIAPAHPADIIAQAIRRFSRTEGAGRVGEIALSSLHAAGYRILGKDEVDHVTVEKCAGVAERMLRFADTTSKADIAISEAIRALGRKA